MSGKKMKKLRKVAYQGAPTDVDHRKYGVIKHEQRIVVPATEPDKEDQVKIRRTGTLVCQDNRVVYQDLKKMRRNKS